VNRVEASRGALALFALATAACTDGPTAVPPEGATDLAAPWMVANPAAVGLDGGELFVAGELAGRVDRMRSLLVVRDGRLAFERYYGGWNVDTLADVRSVTKSVVSTLVGIALEQGYLASLDQPITDFLGRPTYRVSLEHALVTVRHLLTMTSGFAWAEAGETAYNDWIRSEDHVDYLLTQPFETSPGEAFSYNSAAVHLLGVVLEEATGVALPQYADRVLFEPLGVARRRWEELADGHVNGGAGLDLRPRDLARLGQLFLQEGWSGRRSIVPTAWVEEATTKRFTGFGGVGPVAQVSYGYLWWLDLENGAYFAWGFAGQFVYVVPRLDLVVVATTDWNGVRDDIGNERLQEEVLRIIVDRILPAAR
jgi:CubicO group peptidase (beta-lactamase class C family)